MITADQRQMIQNLKEHSKLADKDLIILMRNYVGELIRIIEKQEEILSFYADENNYDDYSPWEQTSPIMQDRGSKASS